jgi:UDP-N-acetylmuramoyl-L-alanyl-D-glutamate--2,6-diaminopimelate ligase
MILEEALREIPVIDWTGNSHVDIQGVSCDSRSVKKGELFVAIKGEKADGASFIAQAIDRGATAVAAEQRLDPEPAVTAITVHDARIFLAELSRVFFEDPSAELKLAGITGTKGKTTTSYLVDSIFRQAGITSCLVGTIGTKIIDQHFSGSHTTPEASDLLRFLREAVKKQCTHGVVEVSSHALALKRVWRVRFSTGVFMNLTHDHLDYHTTMEAYFQAKRLLFFEENGNHLESAVINTDDVYGRRLAEEMSIPLLRFGFDRASDIHVVKHETLTSGTDLTIGTPAGEIRFTSPLIGRPNVYNIMAATGTALSLGIEPEAIRAGIENLAGVPGRLEKVDEGQNFLVLVDYAHSPDSLENLLSTVGGLPHDRIITVFGCGGNRDRTKRPVMGEIAARLSDLAIVTSDNPRNEQPLGIIEEIAAGMKDGPASCRIEPDRRAAIASAIAEARGNDVVVIAGKGHENYQVIGGTVIPFDDRLIARDLIRLRLKAEADR